MDDLVNWLTTTEVEILNSFGGAKLSRVSLYGRYTDFLSCFKSYYYSNLFRVASVYTVGSLLDSFSRAQRQGLFGKCSYIYNTCIRVYSMQGFLPLFYYFLLIGSFSFGCSLMYRM